MKSALILIDIQNGFHDPVWGNRSNPSFELNAKKLLEHWRSEKQPIFHVQHLSTEPNSPLRPDRPGVAFMDFAKPLQQEFVFQKKVHSAFISTDLERTLREQGIGHLVLIGFTADHCVSTTARMGADLGFKITIPLDAVATFDRFTQGGTRIIAEKVHSISLASLHGEFATISSTEELCR